MLQDASIEALEIECVEAQRRLVAGELDPRFGTTQLIEAGAGEKAARFANYVTHITELSAAADRIVHLPVLVGILRRWLGAAMWRDHGDNFGFVYQDARPAKESSYTRISWHSDWQAYPHFDLCPATAITVHIDATSPANGFLRVVPGSQRWATPAPYDNVNGVAVPDGAAPCGGYGDEPPPSPMPLGFGQISWPGALGAAATVSRVREPLTVKAWMTRFQQCSAECRSPPIRRKVGGRTHMIRTCAWHRLHRPGLGLVHTPSLGTRVVIGGVVVVAMMAVGLDLLVYFGLRSSVMDDLGRVLDRQVQVARASAGVGPQALAERLGLLGVQATVEAPDGAVYRSAPLEPAAGTGLRVSRLVVVAPGERVLVTASSPDASRRLRRVLFLGGTITLLVVALTGMLFRWVAEIALAPLDRIAAAARRTTSGRRGERLRPDLPDTRLGQMASAYDDMLDALEQAVAEARVAQARSDRLEKASREILETAHDGFVAMDASGAIIDWNAEAERVFGWARDDVLGRAVADTIIPPELRQEHRAGLERFALTGEGDYVGRTVEVPAMRRSGERFPAELTVWATTHEGTHTFNAFLRDITDRKRAQEAMGRLAAIVETSDDAILSTSLDGLVLTWNQGAERMYGYPASETIGRDLVSLIVPPGANDQVDRSLEAVRLGDTVQRLEVVRRNRSGGLLDVGLTIFPVLDAAGNVCAAASVGRDITEERWIAAKLDATLAALEAALEDAKNRETGTRRFLDDAAHQLRAPITSILACAETLLRGTTEAERDRLLTAVVRQSFRVSRLMTGLLQMARLDQGQAIARKPCDLVALCREESDRARRESPDIEISVTTRGERRVGQPDVDPHAVTDIVSNLLDNARRHASAAVSIVIERSEASVQIEVHDDGSGLPDGMRERAFERFVSLDDQGGSGLGLAIARDLARAHGGDLVYEAGAFILRLPVVATGGPAGTAVSDAPNLSEQLS